MNALCAAVSYPQTPAAAQYPEMQPGHWIGPGVSRRVRPLSKVIQFSRFMHVEIVEHMRKDR